MSKKSKRDFKKLDRMLGGWGFEMDDPIIGKNKAYAELEFAGLDFGITLEKDGKSWKKDTSSIELEASGYGAEIGVLWEFDDVKVADNSILREIESGAYSDALGWLGDQEYSKFNDYIEGIAGFSNAEIVVNGSTFL